MQGLGLLKLLMRQLSIETKSCQDQYPVHDVTLVKLNINIELIKLS